MHPRFRVGLTALGAITLAAAIGCSSSSSGAGGSGSSTSGSGTVSVNVGSSKPISLKKGKLNVALYMNSQTNAYQQQIINGAKEQAAQYGWNLTVFQANFDLQTQNDQYQQAATSHQFDAIATVPVDGDGSCSVLTKTLPAVNVLVVVGGVPLCNRDANSGVETWAPGTYSYDTVCASYDCHVIWLGATVKAFPGKQNAVMVVGQENNAGTIYDKKIMAELAKTYPDFDVHDWIYTDFTTATTQAAVSTYLQGHPGTTVIVDAYSPDIARGVVNAVEAKGFRRQNRNQ